MDFLKKPVAIWVAVAIAVTSLIGTGVYIANKQDDERMQPSSVRVEVAKARRGSLVREMTVVGTLESANSVVMKAQVKGLITNVNIIGGEEVSKGDVLFEIDPRTYEARAKEAQALHNLAKAALDREEKLAEKNFGAAKKLEEARAEFLRRQAQLESAQKELEDTKIVAPFEGRVGLHRVSVGTPITADLDLVTITDTDPMKVNFKMPSKFIRYLSLNQKVSVEVDSYPDQKFEGRIEAIDALVDSGAQSIAVQATIPNPRNQLKPGMFVRVKVTVGSKDNSLIIPEEAVVAIGDQTYVWKVIEHPEKPGLYLVFRVEVLTGIQEKDRIEITRNLREDDIVVTIGYQKVANGIPVSFDLDSVDLGSPSDDEEEKTSESEGEAKSEGGEEGAEDVSKNEETKQEEDKKSLWDRITGFFSSSDDEPKEVTSEPKDESEDASEAAQEEDAKEPGTDASAEAQETATENVTNKSEDTSDVSSEATQENNAKESETDASAEAQETATESESKDEASKPDEKKDSPTEVKTEGAEPTSGEPAQSDEAPTAKAKTTGKPVAKKSLYAKTRKKQSNLRALLTKKS